MKELANYILALANSADNVQEYLKTNPPQNTEFIPKKLINVNAENSLQAEKE
jgi:hypothetical protein